MEKFEKIFRSYCPTAYEGVVLFKKFGAVGDAQFGIDLDKKFPVGGITKLFTIACVLKLIENKKLIIDSKIPIYLSSPGSYHLEEIVFKIDDVYHISNSLDITIEE